jgi:uncharacterized RDD family membrane protein YckC
MAGRREDLGSWLEGTAGGGSDEGHLVLPSSGPGSRATLSRRVVALAIDWTLSLAVSSAAFPSGDPAVTPLLAGAPFATLGVFAVSTMLLVALLGTTIGHRVVGIRVVRLRDAESDGERPIRPPGVRSAVVRTLLLCLVVPAVVWDTNGRSLHDAAAGTVIVRG